MILTLNLIPLLLGPLPLIALIVVVLFLKRLTALNLGDKIILYSWLILLTWVISGSALALLLHKTFFLLPGGLGVLVIILLTIASIFWLAYRLFKAGLHEMDKQKP
jgi:hypothetical protein